MSARNVQAPNCTLRSLESELSRSNIDVDCRWSEDHNHVTFVGEGIKPRTGKRVALFFIPVSCTSKRHVTMEINTVLDGLEETDAAVINANECKGGADL